MSDNVWKDFNTHKKSDNADIQRMINANKLLKRRYREGWNVAVF